MAKIKYKRICKSEKYKYVVKVIDEHGNYWWGVNGLKGNLHKNERDAAINVDKTLILMGKNPVNILIKK